MENKTFDFTSKNVEDAILEGLKTLEISREQAEIEILDQGGFLRKAKVRISKKPTEGSIALAFVETILEKMGINSAVEMEETEQSVCLNIISLESGTIIGHRGDVLDAIQYIASILANQEKDSFKRIVVDCENYRERRIKTLEELAVKMCEKAIKLKKKIHLEPMNPFERRIIHAKLTENEEVTTLSEGEEPSRHLVIVPKNLRPYDGKRPNGGRGNNFRKDGKFGNRPFSKDGKNSREDGERRPRQDGERRPRPNGERRNDSRRPSDRPFEERAPRPKTDFSSFQYLGKSEQPKESDAE